MVIPNNARNLIFFDFLDGRPMTEDLYQPNLGPTLF